jgi:hydroxymethylpyrimidine/phosphomethylpyrimidine kinase
VQNTRGVTGVHAVPVPFVVRQIEAVLEDIPPAAVKTGMLASAALVEAVARVLAARRVRNLVVDPVMVATSGDRLLDRDAVRAVKERLIPLATLVTPNGPEAEILTGIRIDGEESAARAGTCLLEMGAKAALVKGGHGKGRWVFDVLTEKSGFSVFRNRRLRTRSTHGTGCTLSAAIVAGLARGCTPRIATMHAVGFVRLAMRDAPRLGRGHGPLNHMVLDGGRPASLFRCRS